jgi:hypothetical protein
MIMNMLLFVTAQVSEQPVAPSLDPAVELILFLLFMSIPFWMIRYWNKEDKERTSDERHREIKNDIENLIRQNEKIRDQIREGFRNSEYKFDQEFRRSKSKF